MIWGGETITNQFEFHYRLRSGLRDRSHGYMKDVPRIQEVTMQNENIGLFLKGDIGMWVEPGWCYSQKNKQGKASCDAHGFDKCRLPFNK